MSRSTRPVPTATTKAREKVVVVGLARSTAHRPEAEEHLLELERLVDTAGGLVVGRTLRTHSRVDPATCIGRGQADEVAALVREHGADLVVFDDDLSPAQMRNLEKIFETRVLDRSGLILDIFARRARSHEARTQVELAQLQYFLPRLTRRWTHLERQEGRIGSRGVGETQLELDRRIIKTRIAKLRRELAAIEGQRKRRRAGRVDLFKVAIVGYTNAGKSTLMNRITGADVHVEDRLFATLDALVRRIPKGGDGNGPGIVLIDTVGFIRKLPHALVASFRSTLEEVVDSDLVLHIVDASTPEEALEDHVKTTLDVLSELGAGDHPRLMVLNKMDRVTEPGYREALSRSYPDAVPVSALTGDGIDLLLRRIRALRERLFETRTVRVPQSRGDLLSRIRAGFEIVEQSYRGGNTVLVIRGRRADVGRLVARLESGSAR